MENDTDPPGSVEEQFYSVMGLLSEYLDMVSNAVLKDEGKMLLDGNNFHNLRWSSFEEDALVFLNNASLFEIRQTPRNQNSQNKISELQIKFLQLFQSQRGESDLLEAAASGSSGNQTKSSESKHLVPVDEDDAQGRIADGEACSDDEEEQDEATNKKERVDIVFNCPFCEKIYQKLKSLQKHIRLHHKEEKQINLKEYQDRNDEKIPCLLKSSKNKNEQCLKKFDKHQMGRHVLGKKHNVEKPDKKMIFKHFKTDDGGQTYSVVWGFRNKEEELVAEQINDEIEPEPTKEIEPPVVEPATKKNKVAGAEAHYEEPMDSETKAAPAPEISEAPAVSESLVCEANQMDVTEMIEDHEESDVKMNKDTVLVDIRKEFVNKVSIEGPVELGDIIWDKQIDIDHIEEVDMCTNDQEALFLDQNSTFGEIRIQDITVSQGSDQNKDEDTMNMDIIVEEDNLDSRDVNGADQNEVLMEVDVIVEENNFAALEVNVADVSAAVYDSQEKPVKAMIKKFKIKTFDQFVKSNGFWSRPKVPDDNVHDDSIRDAIVPDANANVDINYEETVFEEEEIVEDSDYDSEDDLEDTKHRQEMKETRKLRRDSVEPGVRISDLEQNANFINLFKEYFQKKSNLGSTSKANKTMSLTCGHLFYYPDSFLNWMVSQDSSFVLENLVAFKNDNFSSILSPIDWCAAVGGAGGTDLPSRQAEKLKSHARIRDYILHVLNKQQFGRQEIVEKIAIKEHLKDIADEIAKFGLFKKLKKLEDFKRNKAKKMKQILDPDRNQKEYNAVRTWFASSEFKERQTKAISIWENSKNSKASLTKEKFNKFANFTRFTLAVVDRNRPSTYNFLNDDYLSKFAVYLPDGQDALHCTVQDDCLWSLESLPPGWKLYTSPDDSTPPTAYEIRLDGSLPELKGNRSATVILTKKCFDLCEKYNDLKRLKFGNEAMSLGEPYFVNFNNKKLSRIQRSKGSLPEVFASVVGIADFRMTYLRKAMEGTIQSRQDLSKHTKELNSHNSNVAADHYDNTASSRRTMMLNTLSDIEGSNTVPDSIERSKSDLEKRKAEDELESARVKKEAKEYLEALKNEKKCVDLSPSCLDSSEVDLLKTLFSKDDVSSDAWKNLFYRYVDSLSSINGDSLRALEEKVFKSQKEVIGQELKRKWTGSVFQHKYADIKISNIVKKALELQYD